MTLKIKKFLILIAAHSDILEKELEWRKKLPYQTILETVQTEYKENFSLCVYASHSLFSTDNFLCPKKLKIANCDKKSMMVHHEKN